MGVFCFECEKVFSKQSNLNRHMKEVHNNPACAISYHEDVGMFKCLEGCNISFKFNENLREHLQEKHKISQEFEEFPFSTFNEFEVWLKLKEKNENIRYIKTGHKIKKDGSGEKINLMYFNCARSGKQRVMQETRLKRMSKSQGSSKLNRACTSQIIVNTSKKGCLVKFYKSHYGHEENLEHLRLSKFVRETIASKLVIGVSKQHIIDSARENISSDFKRDNLLTKEDIKNIRNAYNIHIRDGYRNKNDKVSVHLRVQEWKQWDENPILLYKQQDLDDKNLSYEFKKQDFCIIFMNEVQKQMLQKFGSNIICIDSTHGLNPYDFELTTILVIDEFGRGFPTAFMFTNKKDTYINEIFFNEIKGVVGEIKARVFMTDMTGVFYNAWKKIMGVVDKQLYCSWHVDRAWQQNLSKINDSEDRKWIFKTLKYLQTTLNEVQFEEEFQRFLDILNAKSASFYEYFSAHYINNRSQWAYCYRKNSGINTNMHIENMHKVIKHIYLEGKSVRRLDKSLNVLEKLIRDKTIERIISLTKGKYTEHTSAIHKRHRLAIAENYHIEKESNQLIGQAMLYSLKKIVECNSTEMPVTVRQNSSHLCCGLTCKFCNICVHMYECTCMDYSIKHTICKHIHYVCVKDEPSSNRIADINHNISDTNINENEIMNLIGNLDQAKVKGTKSETLVKQIERVAFQVVENINYLGPHNTEILEQILQNMKSALLLSSLNNNSTITETANLHNEAPRKEPVLPPANKNIEKQYFFSTKKKTQKKTIYNKKPDKSEVKIIKELLTGSEYTSHDPDNDHKYT